MKKTRICELAGIEYPIIQGGMTWVANAELAAAVSNAGALGIISANAGAPYNADMKEHLRAQIKRARSLTDKPFGVNIPLVYPDSPKFVDVVIEEGIPVVTTSAGNPQLYTPRLKEAGVKVFQVVASVRHARKAESVGVDAVIAEGYEAGGHNGPDELTTFVLVPQMADAVSIPVVAAGGIADARGLVAAFALGAEAVQMGTAFVATHECVAHPTYKQAIVDANDVGSVITARKLGPARIVKGELAFKILQMEAEGASAEELEAFIGPGRARLGSLEGDLVEGEGYCGAIAGLIKQIVSAAEVVERVVGGVPSVLGRLDLA